MKNDILCPSRRNFLRHSTSLLAGALLLEDCACKALKGATGSKTKVNGHLWVCASKFPPNWDVTPNLEAVFADFSYAGIDGVEMTYLHIRD